MSIGTLKKLQNNNTTVKKAKIVSLLIKTSLENY